ncbi:hypothetical protein GCM10010269_17140 [Streptomyces humidus]|uniref:LPXTG cell wall anchor domain-containing protein n=1 Tax=Streptomyces humidus TaxID=52259 RepID=A0A918FSQ4_9ACTN|nr:hypothetical protein [Streptomyces humidus]GGR78496.1 hypothetical protein GCM10010269_17140 [Streptomyces humidus]
MSSSTLPPAFGTRLGAAALTVLAAAGSTFLAAPSAAAVEGDAGDIRIHREQVPPGVSKDDPVACRFYLDAANFGELKTIGYEIKARPPASDTATVSGTIALTDGAGHTATLGLAEGSYTLQWPNPASPGVPPLTPKTKIFKINCPEGQRGHEGPNRPIADDGRENAAQNGPSGPNGGGPNGGGREGNEQGANGQSGNAQSANGQSANGQSGNGQSGNGQSANGQGGGWSGEKGGGGPEGGVHAGGGGLADASHSFTPLAGAAAVGLVALGGVAYVRLTRRRNHGAA